MGDGAPDPACFPADLTALLDHVGAGRAALVGQSMGGWKVLGCALAMPARMTHLVLAATLAGLTDDAILARLAELHGPGRPFDSRQALAPDFPVRDPVRTFLYEEIAALNPPLAPAFLGALIRLRYPAARDGLGMPVTFIAGGRDQLFPPDVIRMAHARLPGAALVVVPEAGHSAYFECPEEFNRALAIALAGG